MRTEVKIAIVVGLIVFGGGIAFVVSQGKKDDKGVATDVPMRNPNTPVASTAKPGALKPSPERPAQTPLTRPPVSPTPGNTGLPVTTRPAMPAPTLPPTVHTGEPNSAGPIARPTLPSPTVPNPTAPPTGATPGAETGSTTLPPSGSATGSESPTAAIPPPTGTVPPTGVLPAPDNTTPPSKPLTGTPLTPTGSTPPAAAPAPAKPDTAVLPPAKPETTRTGMTDTPPVAAGKKHVVEDGETLWSIAQDAYGDGNLWAKLKTANPQIDPDRLIVGQEVVLPPKEVLTGKAANTKLAAGNGATPTGADAKKTPATDPKKASGTDAKKTAARDIPDDVIERGAIPPAARGTEREAAGTGAGTTPDMEKPAAVNALPKTPARTVETPKITGTPDAPKSGTAEKSAAKPAPGAPKGAPGTALKPTPKPEPERPKVKDTTPVGAPTDNGTTGTVAAPAGTTVPKPADKKTETKASDKKAPADNKTDAKAGGEKGAKKGGRTYKIASGDSLASIARAQLGNANRWREIYNLNKSRIPDPNHLLVGTELRLPEK